MKIETFIIGKWEKYPEPILPPGSKGKWDDTLVGCPHVWKEADGNYYMSFTGQNYKSANWAISIAKSNNLFNWQKIAENPVLSGDKIGWDSRIDGATIFKHNNQYYLFYEAVSGFSMTQNKLAYMLPTPLRKSLGRIYRYFTSSSMSQATLHAENRAIGLAISRDLLKWEKFSGNPVLKKTANSKWDSAGVFSPHIQEMNGVFYMFYGGSDGKRICSGIATSKDLHEWKRFLDAPILLTGSKGEWDEREALIVSVIRLEDGWCAFYEGEDNKNNYRIGIAYSYDSKNLSSKSLIGEWVKYEGNPMLNIGSPDSFDARIVCSPHIFLDDGKPYLFFSAHDRDMRGSCGVAIFKPNK